MERLTKEKREILHLLNMASREQRKTNDIHEWYFYYSRMQEELTAKELRKRAYLHSKNKRKKSFLDSHDLQNEWRNLF